ncbi:MAG TPA: PHB depolymerase family esterase [Polyangiaceae bacterium]|nr:PHB depolymerase family esterase [Polyangiaceae bacterium]
MSFSFVRGASIFVSTLPLLVACSNDAVKRTSDGGTLQAEAGPLCSGKQGATGATTITVPEPGAPDGGLRTALVHVPASYDPTKPAMLVLNFHGLLEPNTLQESVSHMSDTADQRNFIVVYPAGLAVGVGLSWNAGTCCGNSTDDMTFIRDLVKKLEDDYCIDPKRVFATGLSNGAMMAYRLGCEASDVFAAVAPVAGAVLVDPCSPTRPVPLLAFHGTGDTIVPFNGGTDGLYHVLQFPPVSYSINLWRSVDGCPDAPATTAQSSMPMPDESTPDGGPNPSLFAGSQVTYQKGDVACHTWSGCKQGSEVELCTVIDGGHAWPGGAPLVGKTTMDIDATSAIIDFFDEHAMP